MEEIQPVTTKNEKVMLSKNILRNGNMYSQTKINTK